MLINIWTSSHKVCLLDRIANSNPEQAGYDLETRLEKVLKWRRSVYCEYIEDGETIHTQLERR